MRQKDVIQQFRVKVLKVEFEKKALLNERYSLRKFAAECGIEASTLSQYLRNKRIISDNSFLYLLRSLGIDGSEVSLQEEAYLRDQDGYYFLDQDLQRIATRWYYFAILELIAVEQFQPCPKWISKTLKLDLQTTRQAVEDLIQLGAITVDENGWHDTYDKISFLTSEHMDTQSGRSYQKQLLALAEKSIEKVTGEKKSHTNVMVAVDSNLIPELKKRLRDFRRDLAQFADEKSKKKNSVYNLQINLHPLDIGE